MDKNQENHTFKWPLFILMSSITFMAILSELVPSGILPELQEGLNITNAQAGAMVGWYAIASAVCSIPLISWTVSWNRKRLLMILLIGFSISNILIGIIPNYSIVIVCRIIGGICAGVLWPMISAYGMKLVPSDQKGKAVAVIMAGTTVGMSVGLPVMTFIGTHINWETEFIVLGIMILVIAVLCHIHLPEASGDAHSSSNSPLTLIRNKGILVVILLTFIAVVANYSVYTYITTLVDWTSYPSIELAQILFGIGCFISVWIAGQFIDKHLRMVSAGLLASSAIAFILFLIMTQPIFFHLAYLLWGIGFGALVTVYQTAVSRQVSAEATSVATSLQSASFNFSIMVASSVGSLILANENGMTSLLILMAILLIAGTLISIISKSILA